MVLTIQVQIYQIAYDFPIHKMIILTTQLCIITFDKQINSIYFLQFSFCIHYT